MNDKEKNRVTVSIMGEDYILRSFSSPQEMQQVGRHVDQLMKTLAEKNIQTSRHKIAVLAALNLADELLKLRAGQRETAAERGSGAEDHELA